MITIIGPSPDDKRIYLMDKLCMGAVNRAREVQGIPSGKGVNAARALRCVGAEVRLLIPAGPRFRVSLSADRGLAGALIEIVDVREETRSCITVLETNGRTTEIVEEAAPMSVGEIIDFTTRSLPAIDEATAVLLTGSLPPGFPPDFYTQCARRGHERGVPVVVDAQGETLLQALRGNPTVVKITLAELAATLAVSAARTDVFAAAASLRAQGARHVVLTDGPNPVQVVEESGEGWCAIPSDIYAINATGSGDAMSAGIAYALAQSYTLPDAVRNGMRMGSANAASLIPGFLSEAVLETVRRTEIPIITIENH